MTSIQHFLKEKVSCGHTQTFQSACFFSYGFHFAGGQRRGGFFLHCESAAKGNFFSVLCFSTCSLQSSALGAYQKAQFLFDMATCGVQGFWKKGNHCKSLVCFAHINFKAFCVLVGIQICQPGGWVRSDPKPIFYNNQGFLHLSFNVCTSEIVS